MINIRLVLADLDGTVVLPEAQDASIEVTEAIQAAISAGTKFAAVTGRPFWMAKELLHKIGFVDPCIFEGGAVIINPTSGEVLWSKKVPINTTKKVVDILGPRCSIIEYGTGVVNAEDIDLNSISSDAFSVWASVPIESVGVLVDELRKLPLVAVHSNDGPAGDFTRSGIQVTHIKADKEHAVQELLKILNIEKLHTLAIGDGNNDLPLFKSATIKIAVDNASADLKAEADFIVSSVDKDGFADAIKKYVLL